MINARKPDAEVEIGSALVHALLKEQHPDLANLRLRAAGSGWDNAMYRIGENLAIRLPRRAIAAPLIEHEQRWLRELAPSLPIAIPVVVRIGRPGCGFPWSWSISRWFKGVSAALSPPADPHVIARQLGDFVRALHQPAPNDAPRNPVRGVPLVARAAAFDERLTLLDDSVNRMAVAATWNRALGAPGWAGPPLWIHGDLHPGNLIVEDGRIAAVIDFGDITSGDPATDLSFAWTLPSAARSIFRQRASGPHDPIDDQTWMRARGWALALGTVFATTSGTDQWMRRLGRMMVDAAVLGE